MSGTITINSTDLASAIKPQLLQMPEISTQPYGYIIFTDGTNYYAKNGRTGQIDFSGTDAVSVINNAISTASNQGGGIILIKAGTYPVDNVIYMKSNVSLIGEGESTKLVRQSVANTNSVYKYMVIRADDVSNIRIENLAIDGNKNNLPWTGDRGDYPLISLNAPRNAVINKVYLSNARGGAILDVGYGIQVRITNSVMINGGGSDAPCDAIHMFETHYTIVTNNIIANVTDVGTAIDNSFYVVVHGNIYELCSIAGVAFYNSNDSATQPTFAVITNNIINGSRWDIWIGNAPGTTHKPESVIIANNELRTGTRGIYVNGGSIITIANNIIRYQGGGNASIELNNTFEVQILNNLMTDAQYGILFGSNNSWTRIYGNRFLAITTPISGSASPMLIKHNIGYTTENGGIATFSGDGTTTQFNIAHGLVSTPSKILITPGSNDAKGTFYATADATYIYVNYATAPPTGTNNVVLYWYAEV